MKYLKMIGIAVSGIVVSNLVGVIKSSPKKLKLLTPILLGSDIIIDVSFQGSFKPNKKMSIKFKTYFVVNA